jgi:hypothetical protein
VIASRQPIAEETSDRPGSFSFSSSSSFSRRGEMKMKMRKKTKRGALP